MSVLSIVQSVCQQVGLPSPSSALGNPDQQVTTLVALLNTEGIELAARYQWQALTLQASFTTVASESQGVLATIAPGLKYILNDTIWNRTLRRPVFGPLSPQRWQQLEAMVMQGPWNQFRIRGGNLLFIPLPAAGQSCYFEYISKNWVLAIDGVTTRSAWLADTDSSLLDEDIMTQGLIWRWKAAKGFNYAEDYAMYERRVTNAMGRDGGKDTLNMGDIRYDIYPGIMVPSGSWGQ